jgi:ribosomal protein L11 methyltransferase
MAWIQLTLDVATAQAEVAGEACLAQGAVAITWQDAQDTPVFEPLPGETRLWGETQVVALYPEGIDLSGVIAGLEAALAPGQRLHPVVERLADRAWEREALAHWTPQQFGERLWISPSWQTVADPAAITVLLDPGLAFGTGSHPTTALCLTWLATHSLKDKRVVDFGCGSGILAIAALKLGALSALGIDQEPQALQASRDNAQRNGVADRLLLLTAEAPPAEFSADVVLANILAEPLKKLAPQIARLVRPGGHLVLSGIVTDQVESVLAAYTPYHFSFDPIQRQEEWCCLSAVALL